MTRSLRSKALTTHSARAPEPNTAGYKNIVVNQQRCFSVVAQLHIPVSYNSTVFVAMVLATSSPDGGEMSADGTKKKKLTNLEKGDGRRLVEYLVVVSSVPRADEGAGAKAKEEWDLSTSFDDEEVEVTRGFRPQVTARYPVEDHSDNPLHENVTFFCHPSGSIHLKKQNHMPKVQFSLI